MGKKARQVQARPPDDEASEDSDDSDVEAARREDERGRTVLAAVGKAIQNGTKIPLEWHPVYKIPCGEYKPTFATYIGVVVRERVCISYEDWKKVPQEVLDELYDVISVILYTCITMSFGKLFTYILFAIIVAINNL